MRFWRYSAAALCLAAALLPAITGAHAQQNARRVALKSAESTELREFYIVVNCQSILIGTPVVEVLDGPEEVTVTYKEGMKLPRAQGCAKQVPGGSIIATAKDVARPKETKLTVRLNYNTKMGERQLADAYIVSLFPTQPSCRLQIGDAPQHRTGRVTGFVSEEQALASTKAVEAQVGAPISPAYLPLQRATVADPQSNFSTMAAIPKEMSVQMGDLVELNSRYRDPSLPCHFIPWTINRLVDHAK
jgi:hypothetical protein